MDILAFVDLHGNEKALNEIKRKALKADVIVCAGDLSIFENNLDVLIGELGKLRKKVLIVPGNHEESADIDEIIKLHENVINIHKVSLVVDDYLFLGYGGAGFLVVDREFEKLSKKFEKEVKKHNGKVILVTHAPPYKTKIDEIMKDPCGNKSIKNFILKVEPDLAISGHLHETAGKEDRVGKTKIINPGPFGKIINI